VRLHAGTVLCEPGEATRRVYFPSDCIISLVTVIDGEQRRAVAARQQSDQSIFGKGHVAKCGCAASA
jgi:hypothetical protein